MAAITICYDLRHIPKPLQERGNLPHSPLFELPAGLLRHPIKELRERGEPCENSQNPAECSGIGGPHIGRLCNGYFAVRCEALHQNQHDVRPSDDAFGVWKTTIQVLNGLDFPNGCTPIAEDVKEFGYSGTGLSCDF